MKRILLILSVAAACSSFSMAQQRDTLRLNSIDLVSHIAYNPKVDKLLLSGCRITGPYSYSAFIAIKDFTTGKEEVVPTYEVHAFPGYKFRSGEIYGWIDDNHVLIKQVNLAKDSTGMWTAYDVHTMQCQEIKFEHEIKLNDDILVDDGAIVYMPWNKSGAKNVYRYDFYSKKTTLYHSFQQPGYVNLVAFSQSEGRLFFNSKESKYLNYLQNNMVKEIPQIYYGKDTENARIGRFDFRYDARQDKLYFVTRVSRTVDTVADITMTEAYRIDEYDFKTNSLNTLDRIPISKENYWDIRGFEIFKGESLLLSVEKRLTEEEAERKSIEGPVIKTKIWDMDVTIPTRLNTQKFLVQMGIEE